MADVKIPWTQVAFELGKIQYEMDQAIQKVVQIRESCTGANLDDFNSLVVRLSTTQQLAQDVFDQLKAAEELANSA